MSEKKNKKEQKGKIKYSVIREHNPFHLCDE